MIMSAAIITEAMKMKTLLVPADTLSSRWKNLFTGIAPQEREHGAENFWLPARCSLL
jgi:hypothetical protein